MYKILRNKKQETRNKKQETRNKKQETKATINLFSLLIWELAKYKENKNG